MDATLFDLGTTYGIAGLLLALGVVAIAVLPWRAIQVRATVEAYDNLSTMSGGFARTRLQAFRRGITRLTAFGRRPATLTRTLS